MNGKNMIIISSRKDFDDSNNISRTGHIIKKINLAENTFVVMQHNPSDN